MLRPKQLWVVGRLLSALGADGKIGKGHWERTYKRAMLTMMLSVGKLFRMFPLVLSPKVRKPARAMARQATMEMLVERCVTRLKRSMVGFLSEPYIKRLLWSGAG